MTATYSGFGGEEARVCEAQGGLTFRPWEARVGASTWVSFQPAIVPESATMDVGIQFNKVIPYSLKSPLQSKFLLMLSLPTPPHSRSVSLICLSIICVSASERSKAVA